MLDELYITCKKCSQGFYFQIPNSFAITRIETQKCPYCKNEITVSGGPNFPIVCEYCRSEDKEGKGTCVHCGAPINRMASIQNYSQLASHFL
jgi:hypothetical protein